MKGKPVMLFAVAIGCGTIAMLGVQKSLSRDRGGPQEPMVKVLVAKSVIEPNVPLDETNVGFKAMPESTVPEGAVTRLEQYEKRALKVRAYPGDLILEAKLADGLGATSEIPEGMRVVTISVDATKTHSGLVLPGNQVDVLVTYRAMKQGNQYVQKTRTVLENIKVFATDNRREAGQSESGDNAAKNISLLVTPEQANLLMLSESKGKLHLALRRDNDATQANAYAVDDDIFEDAAVGVGETALTSEDADADVAAEPAKGDVRSFLEQAKDPAPSSPEPAPVVEAVEKPKWKVSIYSGDTVKVEEVELPEPLEEPEAASKVSEPSANGAGGMLKGLFIRFFAGA